MKIITRKQIPVLLKKIAGRAAKNDGLTWVVSIGPDWDDNERIRISVYHKNYPSQTLLDAAVVEESKAFRLLLEMHINRKLDEWHMSNVKKDLENGDEHA